MTLLTAEDTMKVERGFRKGAVFYRELGVAKHKHLLFPLGPQAWHCPLILLILAFRALGSTPLLVKYSSSATGVKTDAFLPSDRPRPPSHLCGLSVPTAGSPSSKKKDCFCPWRGASHQLAQRKSHGYSVAEL